MICGKSPMHIDEMKQNELQRNRLQITSSFRCSSCAGHSRSRRYALTCVSSRQISVLNMFGISCINLQQIYLVDIASANEREVGRLRHHFWMLAILDSIGFNW